MLSFEQIIEKVSLEDIMEPSTKADTGTMSAQEQQHELSIIARLIAKGHAGYDLWDKNVKKQFSDSLTDLYNNADSSVETEAFYQKLDKILQILPDEHLRVYKPNGNPMPRVYNQTSVGPNLEPREQKWKIYSEDGKTAIIALPSLGNTLPDEWIKFSKELDEKLFKPDGSERYSSVIIDIRDNPGGASIPFEILAKKLYGNEVPPFAKSAYKDSPEADYIRYINGEINQDVYKNRLANHQYGNQLQTICDYSNHSEEFPAFAHGGYKRPIFVMTNRNTASAGEGLCQFLKFHPGVTFVGENTAGCYAEISGKSIECAAGYGVKIGSTHAFLENGETFERKGFAPDIYTQGKDAYAYVKEHLLLLSARNKVKLSQYKSSGSDKLYDRLAHNDFAFIRAINQGMNPESVKQLYMQIYPDKKDNFGIIKRYCKAKTFDQKIISPRTM